MTPRGRARAGKLAALVLAVLAAGCPQGELGVIDLELTGAPGSTLMDAVTRLRVTITAPRHVVEAERTDRGFDLVFEIDAAEVNGAIVIEGFDASGDLIATGQSPAFPLTGINARVVVYVAPPLSIGAAPITLGVPRSDVAATALSFGAIFAGGSDANGAASTSIAVYNAYDHTLAGGLPMPAARSGIAIGAGAGELVYLFGGRDSDGNPTGTAWRFATTVAPSGSYEDLGDFPADARARQIMVPVGAERFLITGAPPLELEVTALAARGDLASLPAAGVGVAASDRIATAIFAGPDGVVRFREDVFDPLAPGRVEAGVAALPGGRAVIIGGGPPAGPVLDALVVDAATGEVTTIPSALSVARRRPAVAATSRHLVVAGGYDLQDMVIASADVFDAVTLERIATLPIAARGGTFAIALPNDQIVIGGGDTPNDQLELFTPPPPELP